MTREAIAAQLGIASPASIACCGPRRVLRRPRSGERSCQLQCADAAAERIFGFRRPRHRTKCSAGACAGEPRRKPAPWRRRVWQSGLELARCSRSRQALPSGGNSTVAPRRPRQSAQAEFVHVEDLVAAVLAALDNPLTGNKLYNICMDKPVDYGAVAAYLKETRGLPFLNTYRTMCLNPEGAFRSLLEQLRLFPAA
jgi:hypothetical protein